MANAYARGVLGIARPRVGLMSVGEEETQGQRAGARGARGAQALEPQLRRQRGGPRPLHRQGGRGRDGRLHGQRRAEGLRDGRRARASSWSGPGCRAACAGALLRRSLKPAFEAVKRRSDPARDRRRAALGPARLLRDRPRQVERARDRGGHPHRRVLLQRAASTPRSRASCARSAGARGTPAPRRRAHERRVRVPGPGLAAGRDGAGARRRVRREPRGLRRGGRGARLLALRALLRGPRGRAAAHGEHAAGDPRHQHRRAAAARGARRPARLGGGPQPGRVQRARGRRLALARGRASHRAPARPVHAGGGARRNRGDGGDPRARAGRDRGRLPRSRAGRGRLARERQLARAGRDRRARGRGRAGLGPVQGEGRQAGGAAAGVRALPLRADAAGAGPPGPGARGPGRSAIPCRRS